ncbi:hypothetical protein BAX94_01245 [Elizabethkingia meningoseptica]|uniref:Uncharacterized protein n=2 Tax=Elizabethkingia meningoseptica TaxID=238 RepID=A0A1T3IJV6_ELIME|nr:MULTISPECIES: FISUMP domain-containing protein [Elizabethkingia]AQX12716.1 hypothetical protein BBD35_10190 [Elizabethkingia meningoseptica]MBG0514228.1 hypothetical protein [Elizabethkingia meningoseptica]MDE5433145.1 fibrobacter succinogenes major paralogous domain-containing protein [Elizabethkingia meningoseptica]MDE5447437.1 fibrobacter succinogenes major paralogous domain-containing protein [Elizabethkingia meningoseptica]MDE5471492.1 fibrobacter succinogenes major paralogous domain-c
MKKNLYLFKNIYFGILIVFLNSCRSSDTENTLIMNGASAVTFNLLGSEYGNSGDLSTQASIGKVNILNKQSHTVLVSPSNVITAELSPFVNDSKISTNASLGLSPVAAVSGNPLTSGVKFRVIAYRKSNGNYHTHKDYTVGQPVTPMMLDNGSPYDIVVYSFGTNSLPTITSGEQLDISNAQVDYDNTNRDFMYQKIPYTPVSTVSNTLNIILRHKLAQITTIVNVIGDGTIKSINSASLGTHSTSGKFSLFDGNLSGRSAGVVSTDPINFPSSGFPGKTQTADPVFLNSNTNGTNGGSFNADVNIVEGSTNTQGITKKINLNNIFKITPENKSNLTINLRTCSAYTGPSSIPGNLKLFMCYNLGANTSLDPFTPAAGIHGAKYQWGANTGETGYYASQSDDQTNSVITGWVISNEKDNSYWSDGVSKGTNDPCPAGYRVPTQLQWQNVIRWNTLERIGTWATMGVKYDTVLYLKNNNQRTLMLPAAGYITDGSQSGGVSGAIAAKDEVGYYWSSSTSYDSVNGKYLGFYLSFNETQPTQATYLTSTSRYDKNIGASVRCIQE